MTRRSPVTTYLSPLEMRSARQKPGMSGGALLAAVVMVAAYALAGWLAVRKHEPVLVVRPASATVRPAETWAPPALKSDLERHPCAGCEP